MTNPWLNIPASDYERHMDSPNVAQLSFLAETFKEALENHNRDAIALLGCATGNGLEYVKKDVGRLTVVDINPEYLEILRRRYGENIPGLEIVLDDLEKCSLEERAYSLVFAGLIFEYLEPKPLLQKIAEWLEADGVMVAVLQLPAKDVSKVTKTPYASLSALNSTMNLVDPGQFKNIAKDVGLMEIDGEKRAIETGKSFYIGEYRRIEGNFSQLRRRADAKSQ